jgi:hypothetical protein
LKAEGYGRLGEWFPPSVIPSATFFLKWREQALGPAVKPRIGNVNALGRATQSTCIGGLDPTIIAEKPDVCIFSLDAWQQVRANLLYLGSGHNLLDRIAQVVVCALGFWSNNVGRSQGGWKLPDFCRRDGAILRCLPVEVFSEKDAGPGCRGVFSDVTGSAKSSEYAANLCVFCQKAQPPAYRPYHIKLHDSGRHRL